MISSVQTLLTSMIDYAGVFPPAQLRLQDALTIYDRAFTSPEQWLLGRCVIAAAQLANLEDLLQRFPSFSRSFSVVVSKNWRYEIEQAKSLHHRHIISLTALEFPILPLADIDSTLLHIPQGVEAFFEVPLDSSFDAYLTVLRYSGVCAKIRTGGTNVGDFLSPDQIGPCLFALAKAPLRFKATAGLHHPLPGIYPLTDAANGSSIWMQGFLNLAMVAALIYWKKVTPEQASILLQLPSCETVHFTDAGILWQQISLSRDEIQQARLNFFRSFGSCAWAEPIADLRILNLL